MGPKMPSPPRDLVAAGPGRLSLGSGLTFLAAAAPAAALSATDPFAHGWWLVAYLALVGGLSQLLLGLGRAWLLSRAGSPRPRESRLWAELTLWNVGASAVPIGVFTDTGPTILVGSTILLIALVLYAGGLRRAAGNPGRPGGGWVRAYYVLVGFLLASVLAGTGLAAALPWQ
jgi:hypothetical protein